MLATSSNELLLSTRSVLAPSIGEQKPLNRRPSKRFIEPPRGRWFGRSGWSSLPSGIEIEFLLSRWSSLVRGNFIQLERA